MRRSSRSRRQNWARRWVFSEAGRGPLASGDRRILAGEGLHNKGRYAEAKTMLEHASRSSKLPGLMGTWLRTAFTNLPRWSGLKRIMRRRNWRIEKRFLLMKRPGGWDLRGLRWRFAQCRQFAQDQSGRMRRRAFWRGARRVAQECAGVPIGLSLQVVRKEK